MSEARSEEIARPYGIAGLIVSLAVAAVLMGLLTAIFLAVAGAAYAVIAGKAALGTLLTSVASASRAGNIAELEISGYVLGAAIYAGAIGALLLLARFRGGAQWRDLVAWRPWSPLRAGWRYWLWVVGGIAYGIGASVALSQFYPQSQNWFPKPEGPLAYSLSFLLVVVLAPIAEEMLFRGWIYTILRKLWPFPATIVVTAAIFALAHWESTHLYALVVFPVGLLLGFMRERTGSIKASATLHAAFNFCGWLLTLVGG